MKPKKIIITLLALAAAGIVVLAVASLGPPLAVLADGRIMAVAPSEGDPGQTVSVVDDSALAAEPGTVRMVLTGFPRTVPEIRIRLTFGLDRVRKLWIKSGWMGPAGMALGIVTLILTWVAGGRNRPASASPESAPEPKPQPREAAARVAQAPRLAGLADVERFFLNLYRRQIGAPPGAPGRIEEVERATAGAGRICQLSVQHNGEWRSRRMSLGSIGEGTGSRSQCFYAIFDTHMVIKIPPTPVSDFEDYVQRIRYESALVARLSPRVCIIPSLSVILSRVRRLDEKGGAAGLEDGYIDLLRASPEYRDFLRIGGAFAFFMDLSRHHFMGQALSLLDRPRDLLTAAVRADAREDSDCQGFEARYGEDFGWVCDELEETFRRFDAEVHRLPVDNSQKTQDIGLLRETFFQLAADLAPRSAAGKLPDSTAGEIFALARKMLSERPDVSKTYARMTRSHAEKIAFARNRPRMEAMAANLLELLAWLGKKGVAMRDLKPDNLLVTGDPDAYPIFLSSADGFALGLIDLETACDLEPFSRNAGTQPPLSGTPSYATPAHFFPNRALARSHDDLAALLHYQDWHAVTAIIFEIATRRRLFGRTAGQIPRIMTALQSTVVARKSLAKLYRKVNPVFWDQAAEEFSRVTRAHARRLDSLKLVVPSSLVPVMEQGAKRAAARLAARFEACLGRRTPAVSAADRQKILACSPARLQGLGEKYRGSGGNEPGEIQAWFRELAAIREKICALEEALAALKSPAGVVTFTHLLTLMHAATAEVMAVAPKSEEKPFALKDVEPVSGIRPRNTATVRLPA